MKPTWRKALWCEQPYPDNHTDENFLECLIINADVVQRSYKRVVWASLAVDLQVCFVSIVASAAYHLYQGALTSQTLLLCEALLFLLGTVLFFALSASPSSSTSLPDIFSSTLSLAALLALTAALSPVYATLTASISPDTIVACSAALLLAHLYLHDYYQVLPIQNTTNDSSVRTYTGPSLRGSLGLACAMCASVLMASQLEDLADVFALMVLSLEFYILAPPIHRLIAASSPALHAVTVTACIACAVHLLSSASVVLTSSLLCTIACITFFCPMWLVRIHKFKAKINGPWDQAAPNLELLKTKISSEKSL